MSAKSLEFPPSNHPGEEDLVAYLTAQNGPVRNRKGWTPRKIEDHILLCPYCVEELEVVSLMIQALQATEAPLKVMAAS
jgi:hypothetical protein